jgi:DNA polymerase (family 10)
MNPQNRPIADAFTEIANLLELQLADPARIREYRRAARVIAQLESSVRALIRQGERMDGVEALGESLASAAVEIAETGSCSTLQRLHDETPGDFSELLGLPNLGPRRVRALHEELGVTTLEQLHEAALCGRLQLLAGFGARLEQQIIRETAACLSRERRLHADVALRSSQPLEAYLRALPQVQRVELAGSLRRRCDSASDIDFVVESGADRDVVTAFANHPDVREVPFAGRARVGVILESGLSVHLRVAAPAEFGAAWLASTGSRAHVLALARLAHRQGLALDDGGLRRATQRLDTGDEASIYRLLGLDFIEPELREDRGEIAAAARGALPRLVGAADLRGDFQTRTREGDNETSLESLVEAARARGLSYIAVSDHLRRLRPSRTNDLERFSRQLERIDELNARLQGFVILKGVHADILEDGRLNVPDSILARADLVVASLGYQFDLSRARQTDRLLHAMDNRFFSILGAPTGRLIEERRPAAFDLGRVLGQARERGCFVELDSRPARLDLDDQGCRMAREAGVLVCIDSCAHDAAGFGNLDFGLGQARRGWLTAADVLNTRPIDEVRALLAPTMRA